MGRARRRALDAPAASAVVREREGGVAAGAIVLTASHNPGGLDGDFGIKFNTADGAPAKEALTDAVYAASETIESYKTVDGSADVDLSVEGATEVAGMVVEVIDPVEDHLAVLRRCFDFDAISALLARPDFSLRFDAMHGAWPVGQGRARRRLGAPDNALTRCDPRPDFGGNHPDPNLKYAAAAARSALAPTARRSRPAPARLPTFGVAADGDGDRGAVSGSGFFVTPSDSLAVIAARAARSAFKGAPPRGRALDAAEPRARPRRGGGRRRSASASRRRPAGSSSAT